MQVKLSLNKILTL